MVASLTSAFLLQSPGYIGTITILCVALGVLCKTIAKRLDKTQEQEGVIIKNLTDKISKDIDSIKEITNKIYIFQNSFIDFIRVASNSDCIECEKKCIVAQFVFNISNKEK